MTTNNRQWLRDATQSLHKETESYWGFPNGFQGENHYRQFLGCALAVHQSLGLSAAKIRSFVEDEHNFSAATWQKKGSRNDLPTDSPTHMEMEHIRLLCADLDVRSPPSIPPRSMSPSYGWGVAYVLNGSTIGASTLLRSGAVQPDWPKEYFEGCSRYTKSGAIARFFYELNDTSLILEESLAGAYDAFLFYHEQVAGRCSDVGVKREPEQLQTHNPWE